MPGRFDVELTQGAEGDLEAIYDYLAANRGADEAEALIAALLEKVETLERFPLRGNAPKELDRLGMVEFRQLLLAPYRLIYRVVGTTVYIALIADGRRDMQTLLEARLLGQ